VSRRARSVTVTVVATMLAVAHEVGADQLAVAELVSQLNAFEGRRVEVAGQVADVKAGASRKGDPYYTFALSDGVSSVMVLGLGRAPCPSGAHAVVAGTVQLTRQAGQASALINAVEVSCRREERPRQTP
jgi:hypothetical protein